MLDIKPYYFYLWQHRYLDDNDTVCVRTCFGITSNPDNRIHGYEGHVGHNIKLERVWSGPERLIRELEDKIKRDFHDYLVTGHRGFRYEWITEDVEFDQIVQYVEWEISHLDGIEFVI